MVADAPGRHNALHPAAADAALQLPYINPVAVCDTGSMSDRITQELDARLRQQQHVAALGDLALRGASFDDLLTEAARLAADGLGTPLAKVLEHIPAENSLLLRAGVGWREGVVGVVKFATDTASPAGYALQTGAPVISNHLAAEARFRTPALLAEHGVRRAMNVVIAGDGPPFGVLEADSRDPGDFHADDVAFLQALAHTLGHALDRERDRQRLEALLAEKELLMQEIHHRVRNSLQIVQSVLSLQSRTPGDPADMLLQAGRRVATIAAVHNRLYRDGAGLEVRLRDYLSGLVDDLHESLGVAAAGRALTLDAKTMDGITWPASDVAPLGIILAELVTNALKHGTGDITVRFSAPADGPPRLTVIDGGPGPPADFDPACSKGLGMRLVLGMLRSRRGALRTETLPDSRRAFVAEFTPG